ncbi:MAG: hypothetical protein IIV90_02410 [Oscillospiraceae bacterium]|nr:hypothetical protein [Oscillospiraceae bacterium]
MAGQSCEYCLNYIEDPETGEMYCNVELDEDEMALFLCRQQTRCPYYQPGDDYTIVRRQN